MSSLPPLSSGNYGGTSHSLPQDHYILPRPTNQYGASGYLMTSISNQNSYISITDVNVPGIVCTSCPPGSVCEHMPPPLLPGFEPSIEGMSGASYHDTYTAASFAPTSVPSTHGLMLPPVLPHRQVDNLSNQSVDLDTATAGLDTGTLINSGVLRPSVAPYSQSHQTSSTPPGINQQPGGQTDCLNSIINGYSAETKALLLGPPGYNDNTGQGSHHPSSSSHQAPLPTGYGSSSSQPGSLAYPPPNQMSWAGHSASMNSSAPNASFVTGSTNVPMMPHYPYPSDDGLVYPPSILPLDPPAVNIGYQQDQSEHAPQDSTVKTEPTDTPPSWTAVNQPTQGANEDTMG